MNTVKVNASSSEIELDKAVMDMLRTYAREVDTDLSEALAEYDPVLLGSLRDKSPKRKTKREKGQPVYARGWRVEKQYHHHTYYNKTAYQLTHLLEEGTVRRDAYIKEGRPQNRGVMPAQPHMRAAYEESINEFEQNFVSKIKGGK